MKLLLFLALTIAPCFASGLTGHALTIQFDGISHNITLGSGGYTACDVWRTCVSINGNSITASLDTTMQPPAGMSGWGIGGIANPPPIVVTVDVPIVSGAVADSSSNVAGFTNSNVNVSGGNVVTLDFHGLVFDNTWTYVLADGSTTNGVVFISGIYRAVVWSAVSQTAVVNLAF